MQTLTSSHAYSDAYITIISDKVPKRPIDRIAEYIDPTLSIYIIHSIHNTRDYENALLR